jgi:hypothetical protein
MPLQSGKAVSVRYKAQSGLGTPASGTGGFELPVAPSPGLTLAKVAINDPTIRADGLTLIGRHGSRSVTGSYEAPLRLNALNVPIGAVLRTTAVPTDTLDSADFTSITTTANTIVAASGDWRTMGVRKGMVIRLANSAQAGNNGRNLTVLNVTATDITTAETLVVDAVADTGADVILPRFYTSPAVPVDQYFTVEEYHVDIDASEVFTDCVFSSLAFSLQPDNTANVTIGVVGRNVSAETGSAAPVLTAPTQYTTRALVAIDAAIWVGGTRRVNCSALDFTYDIGASTVPVIGSTISPDVFKNQATLSGSFSALRDSLADFEAFLDEDEVAISVTLIEPEAAPQDFVSLYIPLAKYTGNDAPLGSDNAMIEARPFTAGLADVGGANPTMLLVSTSGTA